MYEFAPLIVFVLLLAILVKFTRKPLAAGLDKREKSIADQIDEARRNVEESAERLRAHEQKLAQAAAEVDEMLEAAHKDAEALKRRIVAEAQQAAQRERERTLAEIRLAKDAAVAELARETIDRAVSLTQQMLRKEVDASMHKQLIQDSLDKFPSRN